MKREPPTHKIKAKFTYTLVIVITLISHNIKMDMKSENHQPTKLMLNSRIHWSYIRFPRGIKELLSLTKEVSSNKRRASVIK